MAGEPPEEPCAHPQLYARMADYPDENAMKRMGAGRIRRDYPRVHDTCPDCGERIIYYKHFMHYIAGDY